MKKFLQCGLAAACSLSLFQLTHANAFSDVGTHWSAQYIGKVVDSGLMSGTSSNIFSPDDTMTMAHFSVVVVNGAFQGKTLAKDTDTHWADPYLNVLLEEGILNNSNGEFITTTHSGWQDEPIYRYQVASIVARLMNPSTNPDFTLLFSFSDLIEASEYSSYVADIAHVVENGIMTGLSDSEFGVNGVFTRGASCVVISQLLEQNVLQSPLAPDVADKEQIPETTPPETTSPLIILPADSNEDRVLSTAELNAVFDRFKLEYPQGTRWTNDNSYRSSKLGTGYGCAGWAFMISDAIFGSQSKYTITRDELRPGDYFHTGSHFGVIMSVENGYYITTEGNFNSSIYWDYKRTTSYLTENVTYYSRYPKI